MHLKNLRIRNMRAIEDVEVAFNRPISVIIGPNAAGKTTILEAIRLAKAVLAPRTQNEANQAFFSLGAMSPHIPQRLFPEALAHNPTEPTLIRCTYAVSDHEMVALGLSLPQIPLQLAQLNAGLNFSSQNQIASFFSSQAGIELLRLAEKQVSSGFEELQARKTLRLNLTLNWSTGQVAGEYILDQIFYRFVELSVEPYKTIFSYFPADRAIPVGEQPVQLGMADITAQLESYNSQPQTKYHRLKHTIFTTIIQNEQGRAEISRDFELIFSKILRGRKLSQIGISEIGLLSIKIQDTDSGRAFDIDALSSGEKGLILTFLLITRSVSDYGLVLLDEPELHLNPSVVRDTLQFFIDEFAAKRNIQSIICSHSPEMLNGAFEDSSCQLYHLRDGRSLAAVRQHDEGEIRDALQRLGTSEGEAWLYKGTISVEGIHDAEILQAGFGETFRRFKFRQRGGRQEIETSIRQLQQAESKGNEIGNHFFIFDLDGKPSSLTSSSRVRMMQLERYCLENYLLDIDIMTDLTREPEFAEQPTNNTADMRNSLKKLALQQMHEVAARHAFSELGLSRVAFDMKAVGSGGPAAIIAADLSRQITDIKEIIDGVTHRNFSAEFVERYGKKSEELQPEWDERWRELCNGKRLLEQLRKAGNIRGDLLRFKKRIAVEMSRSKTNDWRSLESRLKELVTMH